ncbi:MAG TPA: hypothetical protein VGO93_01725 [Candidatus Xenobia bacterium]|jgi:hypothetical protein
MHYRVALVTLLLTAASVLANVLPSPIHTGGELQPFTSNVVTGTFRGQQHCYVCSLVLNHPAVVVFSRQIDGPTTRLVQHLDGFLHEHMKDNLVCWTVFLGAAGSDAEVALEDRAYAFATGNHLDVLPITVLGDPQGPPGYRIPASVHVLALITHGRRILQSCSFDKAHWNNAAADTITADIHRVLRLN